MSAISLAAFREPVVLPTFGAIMSVLTSARVRNSDSRPLVYLDQFAKAYPEIDEVIWANVARLHGYRVWQLLSHGKRWNSPEISKHIEFHTAFCGPGTRNTPYFHEKHLDEAVQIFALPGWRPAVAIAAISTPDEGGYVSLGPSGGLSYEAVKHAKVRIGIMNDRAPRFLRRRMGFRWKGEELISGCTFRLSDFDYVVHVSSRLPEPERKPLTPEKHRMALALASIIQDGDVVQAGIGMPDDLLDEKVFANRQDLGIFAELVGENAMELFWQRRALCRHAPDPGYVFAAFVGGRASFLERLDCRREGGRLIMLSAAQMVNTAFVVAMNTERHLQSVNGALAVDARFNIASASLGTTMFSGVGGAMRYGDAANHTGGSSTIVMLSTVGEGSERKSRVVPIFPEGTETTLSGKIPHNVITEWGIARNVHGLDNVERMTVATGLCHPDFRDWYISQVKHLFGVSINRREAEERVLFDQ